MSIEHNHKLIGHSLLSTAGADEDLILKCLRRQKISLNEFSAHE